MSRWEQASEPDKKCCQYNAPIISFTARPMFEILARSFRLTCLSALTVGLVACGSVDSASKRVVGWVTPYKIDIVQGNFVSREQAAALQEGMSRTQVLEILGTPLLTSIFHENRWDYVFTFKRQGTEPQSRRVTVFFQGESLKRVEADALPSEAEFVASLDTTRKLGKVPVLEAPADSLKSVTPESPVPAAKALPPARSSYPPLE